MSIKIQGTEVITDDRKGKFNKANPGVYTTLQRNSLTAETGDIIYNSDEGNLQNYNGTEWTDASGVVINQPKIVDLTWDEQTPPGSGTEADPYVMPTETVNSGASLISGFPFTLSNMKPGLPTYAIDENQNVNGQRYLTTPFAAADANGIIKSELQFADAPATEGIEISYIGSIVIGDIYFTWTLSVGTYRENMDFAIRFPSGYVQNPSVTISADDQYLTQGFRYLVLGKNGTGSGSVIGPKGGAPVANNFGASVGNSCRFMAALCVRQPLKIKVKNVDGSGTITEFEQNEAIGLSKYVNGVSYVDVPLKDPINGGSGTGARFTLRRASDTGKITATLYDGGLNYGIGDDLLWHEIPGPMTTSANPQNIVYWPNKPNEAADDINRIVASQASYNQWDEENDVFLMGFGGSGGNANGANGSGSGGGINTTDWVSVEGNGGNTTITGRSNLHESDNTTVVTKEDLAADATSLEDLAGLGRLLTEIDLDNFNPSVFLNRSQNPPTPIADLPVWQTFADGGDGGGRWYGGSGGGGGGFKSGSGGSGGSWAAAGGNGGANFFNPILKKESVSNSDLSNNFEVSIDGKTYLCTQDKAYIFRVD
jgi:hypothetical protein